MRKVLLLSWMGLLCSVASAQSNRDFSGRWYLRPEESELPGETQPDPILRIEQKGLVLELHTDEGHPGKTVRTYFLNGEESRSREGSVSFSSQTKWEGTALLISTNVSSPQGSYSVSDRWKLSRDGARFTIRRDVVRPSGTSEATLVYSRTAKAAPPAVLTSRPAPEVTEQAMVAPSSASAAEAAPVVAAREVTYDVPEGAKLPLRLMNSISTKHSSPGDKVYLETIYPVLSHGKVVIPPGSYVIGSLTEVKQAGRVKGRSEMFLRFDSLTLPNGTTRDFRARMSGMDADGNGSLDRKEGRVEGDGGKGHDTRTVAETTAAGTGIGAIAGGAAGHLGMGAGIGAAAGALGGLASVLATRGPDAVLQKGTTVEMTLDRSLSFRADELAAH